MRRGGGNMERHSEEEAEELNVKYKRTIEGLKRLKKYISMTTDDDDLDSIITKFRKRIPVLSKNGKIKEIGNGDNDDDSDRGRTISVPNIILKNLLPNCCAFIYVVVIFVIIFISYSLSPYNYEEVYSQSEFDYFNQNSYIQDKIIDFNKNPCKIDNFDNYACGLINCRERNEVASSKIDFLLEKLNKSIMTPDRNEATTVHFFKNYNGKMNTFFRSCYLHKDNGDVLSSSSVFMCGGMEKNAIAKTYTLKMMIKLIKGAKNMRTFSSVFGTLASCGIHGRFYPTKIESPYLFMENRKIVPLLKVGEGGSTNTLEFPISEDIMTKEQIKNAKYVVKKINKFHSKNKKITCMEKSKLGEMFIPSKFSIDLFLRSSGLGFEDINTVCFPDNTFMFYFNKLLTEFSTQHLQDYLIYLSVQSLSTINKIKSEDCLKETIENYRVSYCEAVRSRVYKIEKIETHFDELVEELYSFFKKELINNPSDYCIEKNSILHDFTLRHFSNIEFSVGKCFIPDRIYRSDVIEKFYQSECKIPVDKNSFIQNCLNLKSSKFEEEEGSSLLFETFFQNDPYYNGMNHRIVVPLQFILEPLSSIFHDKSSQLGSFGFVLLHEISHFLLKIRKAVQKETTNWENECMKNLETKIERFVDERICDLWSLMTILKRDQNVRQLFISASQVSCCSDNNKRVHRISKILKLNEKMFSKFNKEFNC